MRSIAQWPRHILRSALNRYAPPDALVALKYLRAHGSSAFPERNMIKTDAVATEPVLVLSPHPDDEIIGMGGTLHMHATNGSSVAVLYLTDGAGLGAGREERIRKRRSEAEAVGRDLGIRQIFWEKHDTRLTDDADTVVELVALLEALRPASVYLPSYFDRHYDHFSTNAILAAALRRLPSHEPVVLGYEVWDNVPFQNFIVDITEHADAKKRLMRHYGTPLETTDFAALFDHRGALHYMLYVESRRERSHGYAEAFCRLDAATYVALFDAYVASLREFRSPMLRHLLGEAARSAQAGR
jgi:LmbE family N-acetylglucosaminyl deacetylase